MVQFRLPGTLTMSGITVAMPENRNSILPLNVANYLDSSIRSDMELEVRKAAANISGNIGWLNYLQTAGVIGGINIGNSEIQIFEEGGSSPNPLAKGGIVINPLDGSGYSPNLNGGIPSVNGNSQSVNQIGANDYSQAQSSAVLSSDGTLALPDKDDYSSQLAQRISLIEEYCDKYGKIVDLDSIMAEYGDNPKDCIEVCDRIINEQFNQTFLRKIVHKKYDDYNKSRQQMGEAVADDWVNTVLAGGLKSLSIDVGGVTQNNILDVIGAFALNKDVKNGKVSLENVFESPQTTLELIEVLKSRADKALIDSDVSKEKKQQIEAKIKALRVNYDIYADSVSDDNKHNDVEFKQVRKLLEKNYMELFGILRQDQAQKNDKAAPQYYGLPEDSSIKFDEQSKRAMNEINSYKYRQKLKITI